MLAVPARNRDTTVRYVWQLDREGVFEHFPEIHRWGLPLGQRLLDHPAVGACFTEDTPKGTFQVLHRRASGLRIFPVGHTKDA